MQLYKAQFVNELKPKLQCRKIEIPKNLDNSRTLMMGVNHFCAKAENEASLFGLNDYGQISNKGSIFFDDYDYIHEAAKIRDFKQIYLGSFSSFKIDLEDKLYCW